MAVLDELRRSLGSFNFSAQYQQEPVPLGGNLLDTAWFPRYGEILPSGSYGDDQVFQSWDTASKAGELNDYSVCTTWLVRGNAYYLLDVFRDRLGYPTDRPGQTGHGTSYLGQYLWHVAQPHPEDIERAGADSGIPE